MPGDLERRHDTSMRRAIPARKRLAAQRHVQHRPSVKMNPCGRAARIEVALVEAECDHICCLAADRELDLKLLVVEWKAFRQSAWQSVLHGARIAHLSR